MITQDSVGEHQIRQRYFLLSKRWTITLIFLVLVTYGCAVVWSEFVFSTSTTSPQVLEKRKEQLERLGCPKVSEIEKEGYVITNQRITSPRRPWLFDRTYHYGFYMDFLDAYPGCIPSWILLGEAGIEGNPPGATIYFYDRVSDRPIIKISIESIEK